MKEPKFTDAPCYGVEFIANSKICRVCLANRSCQKIVFRKTGTRQWASGHQTSPHQVLLGRLRQTGPPSVLDTRTVIP